MPPFRFTPYEPGQIDPAIITAAANARARAVRDAGNAAAMNALAQGQASSNVAMSLGQLAQIPAIIRQQQQAQQDAALAQATKITALQKARTEMQTAQRAADEDASLKSVLANPKATPEDILAASPTRGPEILKGLQTIKESQRKDFEWTNQNLANLTGGLLALPAEMRAPAYDHLRQTYIANGQIKPEALPQQFDQNWLQSTHTSLLSADKQEERLNPKPVTVPNVGLVNPSTGSVIVPEGPSQTAAETARHNKEMEQVARLTAQRQAEQAAETARHNRETERAANPFAAMQQAGAAGSGTNAPPVATGPTGEDFLKTLPPNIASEVKAYAEGRRPFPAGFALKSPYFQSLIQMVGQYDPTFDAANYNARAKARTDLTSPSGTGGKTINALNTALQHAGRLSDLIETLDNFESPYANAVVNPLRTATGSTKVTNFKAVAPQLAKEIERAWRGSGGSTADIKDLIDSIGSNLGRQQQREALAQFVELAKGKLDATQQQRDNVLGPAGASIPVLFDQNKAIIDKIEQRTRQTGSSTNAGAPSEGTPGTVDGVPAVWKTVNGKAGWYAR